VILDRHNPDVSINRFHGLYSKNPLLAMGMTVALLSLAGIPPLAGFFGKYSVFVQALEAGKVEIVLVGLLASLVGVYYYFRIVIAMFLKDSDGNPEPVTFLQQLLTVVLIVLSFALGLFPDGILNLF
jgi:NADH-quinone oxidoreductase subunit N